VKRDNRKTAQKNLGSRMPQRIRRTSEHALLFKYFVKLNVCIYGWYSEFVVLVVNRSSELYRIGNEQCESTYQRIRHFFYIKH
jgi:hypothetical protein